MPSSKTITRIAKAYYSLLTDAIDPTLLQAMAMLSNIIGIEREPRRVIETISQRAGQADERELRQVLASLREQFERQLCKQEVSRLRTLFEREDTAGWNAWLETVADCFVDGPTLLFKELTSTKFAFPEHVRDDVARIRRFAYYILQERFEEGYGLLTYLIEQETLERVLKAKLYVFAAEVQLYRFLQFETGKHLLDLAQELAPDDIFVTCGRAVYSLQQSNIPEAKKYLEHAIQQGPPFKQAYYLMGDCYDQQKDYDASEAWYREATQQVDASASTAYQRLLRLYSRTEELFHEHEAEFELLLERATAADATSTYTSLLIIANTYQQYKLYQQAHQWCERAIASEPARVDGYITNGCMYNEEGQFYRDKKRLDEADAAFAHAKAEFQKIIDIDPAIFDGYWFLGDLCEQQQRWQEALEWYQKSLPFRPMWEHNIRTKIGEMWWQLQDYDKAIDEVIQALRYKPDEQGPLGTLESWAEDLYKKLARSDDAHHLYDTVREVVGPTYEASYQNRLGNLFYYRSDYQSAIACYEKASIADPADPMYYSNLSNAWQHTRHQERRVIALEKSVQALQRAVKLAPDNSSYIKRLVELETDVELAQRYGDFALELVPSGLTIIMELGTHLIQIFNTVEGALPPAIQSNINTMRQTLLERYGIRVPGISFKDNSELDPAGYSLLLPGQPLIRHTVPPNKRYCPLDPMGLAGLDITAETLEGTAGCWVAEQDWSKVEEHNLPLWQEIDFPLHHLSQVLTFSPSSLVDHRHIDSLLIEKKMTIVASLKADPTLLTAFTTVLRALLLEYVSIAPLEQLAQAFLTQFEQGASLLSIVEHLRSLPAVLPDLARNASSPSYFRLGSDIEALLASYTYQTGYGPMLALQAAEFNFVMSTIFQAINNFSDPVLLVSDTQFRPLVRALTGAAFPALPVLCVDEAPQERNEQMIGTMLASTNGQPLAVPQERLWPGQPVIITAHDAHSEEQGQRERKTRTLLDSSLSTSSAASITLYLHPDLYRAIVPDGGQDQEQQDDTSIFKWANELQKTVYEENGLILPLLHPATDDQLQAHEVRIEPGQQLLALTLVPPKEQHEHNEQTGDEDASTSEKSLAMQVASYLLNHIQSHLSDFLTTDSVCCSLIILRQSFPGLVASVLARFDLATLTQFLKELLDMRHTIKDLRTILEELVAINSTIRIDPTQHKFLRIGYILTEPPPEGSTLLFPPYTIRPCLTLEGKTLQELSPRDYAQYIQQFYS